MANRKKEVYKPKPMTEGNQALVQGLLNEYDIETADQMTFRMRLKICWPGQSKECRSPKWTII